jgi:hypothetical protein
MFLSDMPVSSGVARLRFFMGFGTARIQARVAARTRPRTNGSLWEATKYLSNYQLDLFGKSLLTAQLNVVKPAVQSWLGDEFFMISPIDDFSILKDEDHIGPANHS